MDDEDFADRAPTTPVASAPGSHAPGSSVPGSSTPSSSSATLGVEASDATSPAEPIVAPAVGSGATLASPASSMSSSMERSMWPVSVSQAPSSGAAGYRARGGATSFATTDGYLWGPPPPEELVTTLRTVKAKAKVAKVGKTAAKRREVTVIRVPPPPPPTPREAFVAKCLEFTRKVAREFPPGCPAFALYKLAITAQRADHAGRCAVVARLRELFRTDAEVTEMFFDLLSPGLRAEFQVD